MAVWVIVAAPIYVILVNVLIYCLNQQSIFWRHFYPHKRAPLLATPRRAGVPKRPIPQRFWAWDVIDARGPATSHCFPRWVLLTWRLLAVAFFAASFAQLESADLLDGRWITYYTNWNFVFLAITNLLGAAVVIADMKRFPAGTKGCHITPTSTVRSDNACAPGNGTHATTSAPSSALPTTKPRVSSRPSDESAAPGGERDTTHASVLIDDDANATNNFSISHIEIQSWTWLRSIHLWCIECQAPSLLFLSIFFWATIYDGGGDVANELFVHSLNNIFPLVDVGVLSRMPFVSSHVLLLLLYTTIYAVFMWFYGGFTDNWPYESMTFDAIAMLAYVVLPVLLVVAFFVYMGLIALREWVARKGGCVSVPASQHEVEAVRSVNGTSVPSISEDRSQQQDGTELSASVQR